MSYKIHKSLILFANFSSLFYNCIQITVKTERLSSIHQNIALSQEKITRVTLKR